VGAPGDIILRNTYGYGGLYATIKYFDQFVGHWIVASYSLVASPLAFLGYFAIMFPGKAFSLIPGAVFLDKSHKMFGVFTRLSSVGESYLRFCLLGTRDSECATTSSGDVVAVLN
jgi:hypothetical protein